jgi:hypothetical protein
LLYQEIKQRDKNPLNYEFNTDIGFERYLLQEVRNIPVIERRHR